MILGGAKLNNVGITINTKDLADLAKRLDLVDTYKDGIKAAGKYVKGVISEYPASSGANSPKPYPGRWYERGYGSKWYTKGGSLRGRKTSQTLGKQWTSIPIHGGMGAEIGNNASYNIYVQSEKYQARFHKARGWKTDQDVVQKESDHVVKIIRDFIEAKLDARRKPNV